MKSLQFQITLMVVVLFTVVSGIQMMTLTNGLDDAHKEHDTILLSTQVETVANVWQTNGGCDGSTMRPEASELKDLMAVDLITLFFYCDDQLVEQFGSLPAPEIAREGIILTEYEDPAELGDVRDIAYYGHVIDRGLLIGAINEPISVSSSYYIRGLLQWSGLISLLAVVFLAWLWIRRLLKPLVKLRHTLNPNSAKLQTNIWPVELHPLLEVIDALRQDQNQRTIEIKDQLESERRFTANAAHELLTPLAAIKLEVQRRKSEMGSDEDKLSWEGIEERADRASHTVNQLMTLARFDPNFDRVNFTEFDLASQFQDVFAEHGEAIFEKQIELDFVAPPELFTIGFQSGIQIMLSNLVDNAIKYCPPEQKITASLSQVRDGAKIVLENDCNPLPSYFLDHIMDRFVRAPGERSTGSGLGLSIVKRVVELHDGEIQITSPTQNLDRLKISITLPLRELGTQARDEQSS